MVLAATNGSAAMLEALLKAGANPNDASAEGETVLMTAARTGNPAAVNVLLEGRCERERDGRVARRDCADVGRRREPRRRGQAADRAWRRQWTRARAR